MTMAENAKTRVKIVMVGVAAAEVAIARTLERVAAMEDASVVETDEIARAERVADLEAFVPSDIGEDPERFVGAWDVGGVHERC